MLYQVDSVSVIISCNEQKLYITTAIPYANAKPHIGNALDYLIADIWRRYQVQLGHDVRMQVGTDEHGNKIAAKAKEAGKEPKAYVDETHVAFKDLMSKVGAEYTDFIRTSDEHHVGAAQYIWQKCSHISTKVATRVGIVLVKNHS